MHSKQHDPYKQRLLVEYSIEILRAVEYSIEILRAVEYSILNFLCIHLQVSKNTNL